MVARIAALQVQSAQQPLTDSIISGSLPPVGRIPAAAASLGCHSRFMATDAASGSGKGEDDGGNSSEAAEGETNAALATGAEGSEDDSDAALATVAEGSGDEPDANNLEAAEEGEGTEEAEGSDAMDLLSDEEVEELTEDLTAEEVEKLTDELTEEEKEELREEYDKDLDNFDWTDRGWDWATKQRGGIPPRPGRRPTRAEKGSYVDNTILAQEIVDFAQKVPEDQPVYNLRDVAPGLVEPRSEALDLMLAKGQDHFFEMLDKMGLNDPEEVQVRERPILRWSVKMVLDTSQIENPENRRVACSVYLRELQEETALTDEALQHIALVAGPRYNQNTGVLRLTSDVFASREDNRINIVDMLQALVLEGDRVHPNPDGIKIVTHKEVELPELNIEEMFSKLLDAGESVGLDLDVEDHPDDSDEQRQWKETARRMAEDCQRLAAELPPEELERLKREGVSSDDFEVHVQDMEDEEDVVSQYRQEVDDHINSIIAEQRERLKERNAPRVTSDDWGASGGT